jgi:hypothetical protein
MWRRGQWRKLLNLIDHLPRNSHYSQAVSLDPEHARLIAEAQESGKVKSSPAPPMATWSPETERLTAIIDLLKHLIYLTSAVNGGKGKSPDPELRPESAMTKIKAEQRQKRHEALAARVLRNRKPPPERPNLRLVD